MLKILARVAALLALVVVAILAIAATKPDTFRVARSISIKAPPEKIFPLINDPHAFNTWNPFLKQDPAAKLTYHGPASGVGAGHEWNGNRNVGKGRFEISESNPPANVVLKLDMAEPMEAHNRVEFSLQPKGDQTEITWAMTGPSPYVAKVMGTVFSVDRMVGGEFEKGLADLKALAEK